MSKSESYIVTVKDGEEQLYPSNVLEQYTIKESKGMNVEDGFNYNDVLQPPVDPVKLNKLLTINTWHKSCCETISKDATGDSWTLIPTVENPSEQQKIVAEEFLKNIKPSINELLSEREYDTENAGWGILEVVRQNGRDSPPIDLKHWSAHTFRRHRDGVRVQQKVGTKIRWFVIMGANVDENGVPYDVDCFTGEKSYNKLPEYRRANEVLWRNRYNPDTKYYGLAPVVSAISAIHGDHFRARYNSTFFKNYGVPAYAVLVTGDFDPGITDPTDPEYDKKKLLRYRIAQSIKEVIKNPHSAMVIEVPSEGQDGNVKIEIQPLSVDAKEASFRLFRKDNRDEVIAAHRVDPNRLNVSESNKLNGSNSKELDNAYKTSVINPLLRSNEFDITYWILKEGLGVTDWALKLLDNDDVRKRLELDNVLKLVESGVMTPNEAREYLGESYGIKRKDDWILDQHYYHGQPLGSSGVDNLNVAGTDSVLTNLEHDFLGEGLNELKIEDGLEDSKVQTVIKAIKAIRN